MNVIIPKPFTEQATSYQHCEQPSAAYAVSTWTVEVAMANLCEQWGGTSTQKSLSSVAQDLRHLGIQRIHWVGGGASMHWGRGSEAIQYGKWRLGLL